MLIFDSPVGTDLERASDKVFPGEWFLAVSYAQWYTRAGRREVHTGVDLNLPGYQDAGKPVYAAADGLVVFAGTLAGWIGQTVCIRHTIDPTLTVWTRYGHLKGVTLLGGEAASRGQQLGAIGDYPPVGVVADHLHYDVARIDLGAKPGDWPGGDMARVLRDYVDPHAFTAEHHRPKVEARYRVTADDGLRVRTYGNALAGEIIGVLPVDSIITGEAAGAWVVMTLAVGDRGWIRGGQCAVDARYVVAVE